MSNKPRRTVQVSLTAAMTADPMDARGPHRAVKPLVRTSTRTETSVVKSEVNSLTAEIAPVLLAAVDKGSLLVEATVLVARDLLCEEVTTAPRRCRSSQVSLAS